MKVQQVLAGQALLLGDQQMIRRIAAATAR
jgi:hypothetical protein